MRLVVVPYRGGAPAMNDALAGHVDLIMGSMASVAQQIESGQLRPLVQCGAQRNAFLPDVPTAMESGVAGFEASSWYSFFGPAGTAPATIDRFYDALVEAVRDGRVRDEIVQKFRVDVPLIRPNELRALIAQQLPVWTAVIRDNNLK